MLVLSREVGERIVIGGEIKIEVLRIRGGRVRLGIEAPPDITVFREELAAFREWGGDGWSMRRETATMAR